ncbi:MAG: ATP-binding protein [Vicinamibacterales bacterium]
MTEPRHQRGEPHDHGGRRAASKLFAAFGDPAAAIRFGRFISPTLEAAFRASRFERDRLLGRRVLLILAAVTLVLGVNDYRYSADSPLFWTLVTIRVSGVLVVILSWAALARVTRAEVLDQWVAGAFMVLVFVFGVINSTRPPGVEGFVLISVGLTFALYLATLVPTAYQMTVGAMLLLVTLAREALYGAREAELLITYALITLAANLIGTTVSVYLQSGQRLHFATLRRAHLIGRYFEQLIDASPNLIHVTDARGEVLFANRRAVEAGLLPAGFDRVAATGQPHEEEQAVVGRDGQTRWYHSIKVPFGQPDGRLHVLGLTSDVTERRRMEAERRALEQQVQQAQKLESLGILAGGIAHDFNNLLAIIMGNASYAGIVAAGNPAALAAIHEIDTAAQRAADLTAQMLAYAGQGNFATGPLDLAQVVADMSALLRSAIDKKTECRLDLREAWIAGDVTQIRQVVMNLITNASEALGGGSGTVTLRTAVVDVVPGELDQATLCEGFAGGPCALLEVTDTGSGMDAVTRSRIFDPFFSTKFTGRGLGLAAVLGIVRRHGGALRVSSEPGQGTTFSIWLPASARAVAWPAAGTKPPVPDGPRATAATPGAAPTTVLVVDDEVQVRGVVVGMLQRAGYRTLQAGDGVEGLGVLEQAPEVSVVLLDVAMPRMDGWQALDRIRRMRPAVKVALMSGYGAPVVPSHLEPGDVPPLIQKPFAPEALLALVHRVAARVPEPSAMAAGQES